MKVIALALLVLSSLARPADAQFYAPRTEFHDMAQRFFPVEAARVLAWLQRQNGGGVASVSFDLIRTNAVTNVWNIRWLDADNKILRSATVQYPDDALTNGIHFYRDVFRQLGGAANPLSVKTISASAMTGAFWDGANRAGYSRMECLDAAFDFWKPARGALPSPEDAARLAGLLAQTTTHGFWTQSSLDSLLLARSAAWLCVVESGGATNDSLWAPILFVANREWQAKAAWTPQTNSPVVAWWNVMLTGVPANQAFLFAAAPEQRSRAMPMMAWHSTLADGYKLAVGRLLGPLFGAPDGDISRLYDYAPGFVFSSVENGHIMDGAWVPLARKAWVKTLAAYRPGDLDFHGYTNAVAKAAITLHVRPTLLETFAGILPAAPETNSLDSTNVSDNCVQQLDDIAPLLRAAYNGAIGPLTPVAHVTARDLLQFGWENAVVQVSARYDFVHVQWGFPELAQNILTAATNDIPHYRALFTKSKKPKELKETLRRLQFVDFTIGRWWPVEGTRNRASLTNDPSWVEGPWLSPASFWPDTWWLKANPPSKTKPIVDALLAQGGRQENLCLLDILTHGRRNPRELREVGRNVTNTLPLSTGLLWDYMQRLRNPKASPVPTPQFCRQIEKMFWSNPDSEMAPIVFEHYLLAGEFPAARAFYAQAMELPFDAVGYSTTMEPARWILGMFEQDDKAMTEVLSNHETGSYSDFVVRIMNAVWHEDYKAAKELTKTGLERYGEEHPPRTLEYIRRALAKRSTMTNPAGAGRDAALRSIVKMNEAPEFQWALIQKLKLSPQDAAILLGGKKASGTSELILDYLQNDRADFDETLKNMKPPLAPETCAMAGWLRAKLHDLKPTLPGTSVRPDSARPIQDLVETRLQGAVRQ